MATATSNTFAILSKLSEKKHLVVSDGNINRKEKKEKKEKVKEEKAAAPAKTAVAAAPAKAGAQKSAAKKVEKEEPNTTGVPRTLREAAELRKKQAEEDKKKAVVATPAAPKEEKKEKKEEPKKEEKEEKPAAEGEAPAEGAAAEGAESPKEEKKKEPEEPITISMAEYQKQKAENKFVLASAKKRHVDPTAADYKKVETLARNDVLIQIEKKAEQKKPAAKPAAKAAKPAAKGGKPEPAPVVQKKEGVNKGKVVALKDFVEEPRGYRGGRGRGGNRDRNQHDAEAHRPNVEDEKSFPSL